MKKLLETYIRSLGEQEQAADAPERYQDLGTFMCWLLERQGYDIQVAAYRREGLMHMRSSGRRQKGMDIIASRPDADGTERLWIFVLKQGNFGRREFARSDRPGSMIADLREAASHARSESRGRALDVRNEWERITVVAAHNGDVDKGDIEEGRQTTIAGLKRLYNLDIDWWDAARLVQLALGPPADASDEGLDARADASLFPPAVRPFARLALDALQLDPERLGKTFDVNAVDQLIEQILPLGRQSDGMRPGVPLRDGAPVPARRLYRAGSELALFSGMLEVECQRLAESNTLPILDTLERVLCRMMDHLRRLERPVTGFQKKLSTLLEMLVDRYIGQALRLRTHLEPLLDTPYGLALPAPGEAIDYPLRSLRIGAYLAKAGLGCIDRNDVKEANAFAQALARLVVSNEGGVLSPIIDDQLIELGAIWMLWLRTGMHDEVGQSAQRLIQRLAVRNRIGLPLPALWMRAANPIAPEHLRALVHAHAMGRSADPSFQDAGTTIVLLAVVLCHRAGRQIDREAWSWLCPDTPPVHEPPPDDESGAVRAIYPQSWQPPDDAAGEWYAWEIRYRGTTKTYEEVAAPTAMVASFEEFHGTSFPASPAAAWQLSVIDWMAWTVHRTPPPMGPFLDSALWQRQTND